MSGDCFIKFDQITGESQDQDFGGSLDVVGWSWGVNWSANRAMAGSTRIRGGADVRAFEFSHRVDLAAAGLMHRCYSGAVIKEALLTMRRAGGKKAQVYLNIRFKNVQIASVDLLHDEANEIPLSKVRIEFESVNFEYRMQAKEGADKTGSNEFNWTLKERT